MHPEAAEIIEKLKLQPHPEGGFFRETFRSPLRVTNAAGLDRSASTAIYFLLPSGTFSAFHRVSAEEVWHHYRGDPLELHVVTAAGVHERVVLGVDEHQYVVPAGAWQAARPLGDRFALCGCTVAPGFDFADFEMPPRATLEALFPQHHALIEAFGRR